LTDAIRIAALRVDPATKKRKLQLIAEKLVDKAIEGDNWCIGQVGDRLDGKPTEHKEYEGAVDHAIRIVWAGMPPISAVPGVTHIENEPQPALPSPQPEVVKPEDGDNNT
jgi:hypothetical protein